MNSNEKILLAHGGGGRLMQHLIHNLFASCFAMGQNAQQDAALLTIGRENIAFTTDCYVVDPLFFAGGDIGSLAVYGTVNDLAMMGAQPLYLSVAFILEEGLEINILQRIVHSMQQASLRAGVKIVTGDTKVVDRGRGHGIFINTTGIGYLASQAIIAPSMIEVGDKIILNGDLARHGLAVLSAREDLNFEPQISSDLAPLNKIVQTLLQNGIEIHAMRDLTRGGLASALNEIAQSANVQINLKEDHIPVSQEVRGACELLGLDPLYVANEGRFVAFVKEQDADKTIEILRSLGEYASCIGQVSSKARALVTLENNFGQSRILTLLSGEQMPRIC